MKKKFTFFIFFLLLICLVLSDSISSGSERDPHPAIQIPIFEGGYNLNKLFDTARETKFITYKVQTNNPPTEVLEFYDAYFNGNGWQSAFEICQRNWEHSGDGKKRAEPIFRQLFASWAHPGKNLKTVLWLTYEAENNVSQNEVVVQLRLYPETAK